IDPDEGGSPGRREDRSGCVRRRRLRVLHSVAGQKKPRGRISRTRFSQAFGLAVRRGALGAGGAWFLPATTELPIVVGPRRPPPHSSPWYYPSRLDHLLSRRSPIGSLSRSGIRTGPRPASRLGAADCPATGTTHGPRWTIPPEARSTGAVYARVVGLE